MCSAFGQQCWPDCFLSKTSEMKSCFFEDEILVPLPCMGLSLLAAVWRSCLGRRCFPKSDLLVAKSLWLPGAMRQMHKKSPSPLRSSCVSWLVISSLQPLLLPQSLPFSLSPFSCPCYFFYSRSFSHLSVLVL